MPAETETKQTITITVASQLVECVVRQKGDVVEVTKRHAKYLIDNKAARDGGKAGGKRTADSELDGWPGDEALAKAGITTIEALKKLIANKGDLWAKEINGIGKATSADVVAKLAELNS